MLYYDNTSPGNLIAFLTTTDALKNTLQEASSKDIKKSNNNEAQNSNKSKEC